MVPTSTPTGLAKGTKKAKKNSAKIGATNKLPILTVTSRIFPDIFPKKVLPIITTAPIPKANNATMLRIMANENLDEWKMSPAIINETVLAAKEFLDGELAKGSNRKELSNRHIKQLFSNDAEYRNTKSKGVGQTTILKFLGGNWKQWIIQESLSTLNDNDPDREAVEMMPSVKQTQEFKKAIRESGVTKKAQKAMAEKVIKESEGYRGTADVVNFYAGKQKKKTALATKPTHEMIDKFVKKTIGQIAALTPKVKAIAKDIKHIQSDRIRTRFIGACDELYNALLKIDS
jgi:hypothetical protein